MIVLTNQHSDNRGDESATIGAVKSLRKYFGSEVEIIVLLQSGTKYNFLPADCHVKEKAMLIGLFSTLELLIWILFKFVGIDLRKICSTRLKEFIQIHEQSEIVISSCAGPYIGDIYINHEFIHLMHLILPLLLKKKIAFFAPSMGPFKNKFMNYLRKYVLNKSTVIILRDEISYNYLKAFLPDYQNIFLTTDACLADDLGSYPIIKKPNTIGITPLDYKYPLAKNVRAMKTNYEKTIVEVLDKLMEQNLDLHIEFFPQLYAKHSDIPFIDKIIENMKYSERAIIFSDKKSGREQQREIATVDFMIATRHHSAIFACKVNTPVISIAYEHKIVAFMQSVNLGDFLLDIYEINSNQLLEKIELLKKNYDNIKQSLPTKIDELKILSNKTAEIIFEYAKR